MMRAPSSLLLSVLLLPAAAAAQTMPVPGCSAFENQVLAHYVPRMTQALFQGNLALFKALADESNPKLSQDCQAAIYRQQALQRQQQQMQSIQRPPSIQEHSDGGLSNGSVYCGPSGCMSLQ